MKKRIVIGIVVTMLLILLAVGIIVSILIAKTRISEENSKETEEIAKLEEVEKMKTTVVTTEN